MNLFAGRSTVHRLHLKVQRNIVKNHKRRYESSKRNTGQTTPSRSVSSTTSPTETSPPPRSWSWSDPILRPFKAYDQMQKRSPLWTQWESAIIIYFLGDLSSQAIVNDWFETERYEPIRGLRSMTIGAIAAIPGYKWFGFLSNHFNYRSHVLSLAAKIGLHQAFFVPAFNLTFSACSVCLLVAAGKRPRREFGIQYPRAGIRAVSFGPL